MKNFTKNTQFYEYLGMGMVFGYFEYLGLGISWVDILKPTPKTRDFCV